MGYTKKIHSDLWEQVFWLKIKVIWSFFIPQNTFVCNLQNTIFKQLLPPQWMLLFPMPKPHRKQGNNNYNILLSEFLMITPSVPFGLLTNTSSTFIKRFNRFHNLHYTHLSFPEDAAPSSHTGCWSLVWVSPITVFAADMGGELQMWQRGFQMWSCSTFTSAWESTC